MMEWHELPITVRTSRKRMYEFLKNAIGEGSGSVDTSGLVTTSDYNAKIDEYDAKIASIEARITALETPENTTPEDETPGDG